MIRKIPLDYPVEVHEHINIMSTNEYIEMNAEKYPELMDFIQQDVGADFTNDFKLEDLKAQEDLYEPHIKLEDILLNKGMFELCKMI